MFRGPASDGASKATKNCQARQRPAAPKMTAHITAPESSSTTAQARQTVVAITRRRSGRKKGAERPEGSCGGSRAVSVRFRSRGHSTSASRTARCSSTDRTAASASASAMRPS